MNSFETSNYNAQPLEVSIKNDCRDIRPPPATKTPIMAYDPPRTYIDNSMDASEPIEPIDINSMFGRTVTPSEQEFKTRAGTITDLLKLGKSFADFKDFVSIKDPSEFNMKVEETKSEKDSMQDGS